MHLTLSSNPTGGRANSPIAAAEQHSGCFEAADVGGFDVLTRVLSTYGAERLLGKGDARASDRALREAARRLAEEARARDPVRAERLLIDLHAAWRALPAIRRLPVDDPRHALWDRIVLLCCEEFYATRTIAPSTAAKGSAA